MKIFLKKKNIKNNFSFLFTFTRVGDKLSGKIVAFPAKRAGQAG